MVATLRKLAAGGRWQGEETVVAYITGHGLKTIDALSGRKPLQPSIPASMAAFRALHGTAA